MKVAGEVTLKAPCDTVWSVLRDPAVLSRAIPGCEWLEITGPGTARLSVRLAIAAVSGSYAGQLSVFREQHREYVAFKASASGDQGTAAADITVRLAAAGDAATLVTYEANGLVSGPVAGVGTRLLGSIAQRIADDFLAGVEQEVTERSALTADAPPAVSPAPPGAGPAPVAVTAARRPRLAVAFGAGIAVGLGGVIAAVILGRKGGRHRAAPR